jgi:anti-anti-sigma factor
MLKVHTRKLGNVAVVSVQGRIVNGETAPLQQEVGSQLNSNSVVLDLARVSTIDASGLGLMVSLRNQAETKGVALKLMNVSKFVCQVFEITGLDTIFEVIPRGKNLPAIPPTPRTRLELSACA